MSSKRSRGQDELVLWDLGLGRTTERVVHTLGVIALVSTSACATAADAGHAKEPSPAIVLRAELPSAPPPTLAPAEPAAQSAAAPAPRAGASRPWLGIEMTAEKDGVVVAALFPGSAAESSGLRPGDRLLSLGHAAIQSPPDVHAALADKSVGEDVEVRVQRGDQQLALFLRLGAKPDTAELLRSLFVDRPAPSISSLRTVSGSTVPSYAQLQDKVVVLEFWATWCVACRAMVPVLNQWFDSLGAQGVRVLAVSSEPFEEVSSSLPQFGMRYPVFVDESTEVSQAYRAGAIPTLFLVDQRGIVREVEVGFDPQRLAAFRAKIDALLAAPAR